MGLLIAILGATISVVAPPPLPMRVQGQALDRSGSPLAFGTPIRTFVDGVMYSNASRVYNGAGSFAVLTEGNSKSNPNFSDTPTVQEGANLGDPVIYAAGDFTTATAVFREVIIWTPGAIMASDLNLGSNATTPQPLKIEGIVARPASGGDQFVLLCNPTGLTVPLVDYFFEGNAPGAYHGRTQSLTGVLAPSEVRRFNLTSPTWLAPKGDALKLVFRNPSGPSASAGGMDIVLDRVEFNATSGGTLTWEPGNTKMGDAPAPSVGRILTRDGNCTDTNGPTDFTIAMEPGLPPNQPPIVLITNPTVGQQVQAATTVTFTWTLSDDIFQTSELHVWANVTIGNRTIPLLADGMGRTSVDWSTPDLAVSDALFRVDVADPFDAHATTTRPFGLTRQSPVALAIAVVIALVLIGFVVFGYLRARKREEPPPAVPPPQTAPRALVPPPAIAPPAGAVGSTQKVCPRCHTTVNAIDIVCFFCGYKFDDETSRPP